MGRVILVGLVCLVVVACTGPEGPPGADGEDGNDGASVLVTLDDEPAGVNCPNGGTIVRVGLDLDGNEVLDMGEVTSTQYVCVGDAGSDGETTLVRIDDEPPGVNCDTGGSAINVGVDDNDDGALQDQEIDSTTYACDGLGGPVGVLEGSVEFTNSGDAVWLAGITEITGNLTVDAPGLAILSLPQLEKIGGVLTVQATELTTLELPALADVGQQVTIRDNSQLDTVALPNLATTPIFRWDNNKAISLEVGLTNVAEVFIDADLLQVLSLPDLVNTADVFQISNCPALTSLSLPLLETAGLVNFQVNGLTSLNFPSLTETGNFHVSSNNDLTSLKAPNYDTCNGTVVNLGNNAMLPVGCADDIVTQLVGNGYTGSSIVTGNAVGSCP